MTEQVKQVNLPIEHANFKADVRTALRYSFILTSCYVILFIIGRLTGLIKIIELRYINYIFTAIVCYWALSDVYKKHEYSDLYYAGFLVTILTTAFAQLWFAILFFIYLNIDHPLASYFVSRMSGDIIMPKFSLAVLLFAEGMGISAIMSLFLIQFFDWRKGLR
jgi:hypothetical protein